MTKRKFKDIAQQEGFETAIDSCKMAYMRQYKIIGDDICEHLDLFKKHGGSYDSMMYSFKKVLEGECYKNKFSITAICFWLGITRQEIEEY